MIPVFQSFWLSLYDWDGLSPTKKFIGLGNYAGLVQDEQFWTSLKNNVYWLVLFMLGPVDRAGNCYLFEPESLRDANCQVAFLFPIRLVWRGDRSCLFLVLRSYSWPLKQHSGDISQFHRFLPSRMST